MSIPKRRRPETTSEHIARDMREGRFPKQSPRQEVEDMEGAIVGAGLWADAHDRLQARVPGAGVYTPPRSHIAQANVLEPSDPQDYARWQIQQAMHARSEMLRGFVNWVVAQRNVDGMTVEAICDAADRALAGDRKIVP